MIKNVLVVAVFCAGLHAAEPAKKSAPVTRPAAPAARKAESQVPASARRLDENTYAWTDPQGKAWQFRRTPFGWAKVDAAEPDAAQTAPSASLTPMNTKQAPAAASAAGVQVIDGGDTVTFVRTTPFGKLHDTRKKSELTAEERALLERSADGAATAAAKQ